MSALMLRRLLSAYEFMTFPLSFLLSMVSNIFNFLIEEFKSSPFYQLKARFKIASGEYEGVYLDRNFNNSKGKEKVSNMIKVASLTRKGFMGGDISTVMSPRTVLHWAENAEIFKDIGYAFRVTYLNKCDDIEKKTIAEYYQRCFGEELPESMVNIQV